MKSRDLAQRAAIARVRCWIVNDDVVALRLGGEVPVDHFRFDPAILFCVFLQPRERGLEFVLNGRLVLISGTARAPLQPI